MLNLLPKSRSGRRYGARPSVADPRDFKFDRFSAFLAVHGVDTAAPIPAASSLQSWCAPVRDQGDEGSCTGHAGYAMRGFLSNKYQSNDNKLIFSPAFIYYKEREFDGTLAQGDCGSTGRSCCQVLEKSGVCVEADDKYVAASFTEAPSAVALTDAASHKVGAYHALASVDEMKRAIASGYGFIVGFAVYESFEQGHWPGVKNAVMPVPQLASEECLGGHEVFFCGYDDALGCFLVQNSWGMSWGEDGFFHFPYAAAANPDILFDAYIAHLGKPW